jgi:hypothetical protein
MNERQQNLKSPEGRVSFPSVFEKSDYSQKFEITLVISKDVDISEMKAEAMRAVKEKWGNNVPKPFRNPFRKCSEKPEWYGEEFDPDDIFITFRSAKRKPGVVDASAKPVMDEAELYPGCWARVSYNAYAYSNKGNNGVSFGLINIQKLRDDNPLAGSAVKAEDDFDALPGSSEDASAYNGGSDDIFGGNTPQGTTDDILSDDDIPF